jgi:hypothetical protein
MAFQNFVQPQHSMGQGRGSGINSLPLANQNIEAIVFVTIRT